MGGKVGVVTGSSLPGHGLAITDSPEGALRAVGDARLRFADGGQSVDEPQVSPGPGCVDAPGSGESGAEVLQEGLEGDLIAPLGEAAHGLLAGLFVRIVQAFAERGPDLGSVRGELRTQPKGGPIANLVVGVAHQVQVDANRLWIVVDSVTGLDGDRPQTRGHGESDALGGMLGEGEEHPAARWGSSVSERKRDGPEHGGLLFHLCSCDEGVDGLLYESPAFLVAELGENVRSDGPPYWFRRC